MGERVFVAMPLGREQDIDFDAVYSDWLEPALTAAGFEVLRACAEMRTGDIRGELIRQLLLADLVVVDLTLDDPDVWYELGVRDALRARGVLLVHGERACRPFPIHSDRELRYHLRDGRPDPQRLGTDRRALAEMARATMASWHERPVSPVFQLLPGLREPAWSRLLLSGPNAFRDAYECWHQRIEAARGGNRAGDVLVLADEAPTRTLRIEARRMAGKALMKLRQYELALEQFEAALALAPGDVPNRRDKAAVLGRLGRYDEARRWTDALTGEHGDDPDNWCLRGRLEKECWVRRWRDEHTTQVQMRARAVREGAGLADAIALYTHAFTLDPAHFRSGINACTLRHLERHLGIERHHASSLDALEGGLKWACIAARARNPDDDRLRAARAQLAMLSDPPDAVEHAWREALAASRSDWFALDASRQQLRILHDLAFRPAAVDAALALVEEALGALEGPREPRRIFLFSGHMIDAPERTQARFPAECETVAANAISARLDAVSMGEDDLAICGGACGGDILFAEAALRRGCRVGLYLQFREPDFLRASVAFAGQAWVDRYHALKANPLTRVHIQPDELGPPPDDTNPYERNNQWQLYTALARGADRVHLISLWNGEASAGPGGTRHMVEEVRKHAGSVHILDTRSLFGF